MSDPVKTDLRARRRADTEARLVAAASDLFVARGYAATTLADVAHRAGLAPRTVYLRFGTKAALLLRCIGVALVGDTEPVAVADRAWTIEAMQAPTLEERIRLMASVTAGLMERAGPLLGVAQQAAATEPAVAEAAQDGRVETRRTLTEFWRRAEEDGLLPRGCDLPWLLDTATLLSHADSYLLLAATTHWEPEAYERWLASTWTRLVAGSVAGTSA